MDANTEMENGGWNLPESSRRWEWQNDSENLTADFTGFTDAGDDSTREWTRINANMTG